MKIITIIGTRPEAIKLAPVVSCLKQYKGVKTVVCVTGQHRQMVDQMMQLFSITPDYDLNLMRPNQCLTELSADILKKIKALYDSINPDLVLVQGDTTSAFCGALAGFYHKIPVAHIEAGLRTHNRTAPWPEEVNRRLIASLADFHFAPTQFAANNLYKEGCDKTRVYVTGNTVIDALLKTVQYLASNQTLLQKLENQFSFLDSSKKLILVTGHRRENFGKGFENICQALLKLSKREDVEIIYPVHLNPQVQGPVFSLLQNQSHIHLIDPLEYLPFVYLMKRCFLILTDSGGVQEEAPSLGKPVLLMRDTTERPEGVLAGTVKLVGTNVSRIIEATSDLLDNPVSYEACTRIHNPYGDGKSSQRICDIIINQPGVRPVDLNSGSGTELSGSGTELGIRLTSISEVQA